MFQIFLRHLMLGSAVFYLQVLRSVFSAPPHATS
jgi:hypothetical protein